MVTADTGLTVLYNTGNTCTSGSHREIGGALRAEVGGGAGEATTNVALDTSCVGGIEDESGLTLKALHGCALDASDVEQRSACLRLSEGKDKGEDDELGKYGLAGLHLYLNIMVRICCFNLYLQEPIRIYRLDYYCTVKIRSQDG